MRHTPINFSHTRIPLTKEEGDLPNEELKRLVEEYIKNHGVIVKHIYRDAFGNACEISVELGMNGF